MTDSTHPQVVAIRRAESRLRDHLAGRVKAPWFAGLYSGLDREDRRPVLLLYAGRRGISDAMAWVSARGGEWEGFRLRATIQQGG
jgi:hypothetical protein